MPRGWGLDGKVGGENAGSAGWDVKRSRMGREAHVPGTRRWGVKTGSRDVKTGRGGAGRTGRDAKTGCEDGKRIGMGREAKWDGTCVKAGWDVRLLTSRVLDPPA